MRARCGRGLLAALFGTVSLVCIGCTTSASQSVTVGAPTVGPPSARALADVRRAISTTVHRTAGVSYLLAGAQVFGNTPTPVTGNGTFDLLQGFGSAVLRQPSGQQSMVLTPSVVYTRVPLSGGAALPPGKTWMLASLTGSESFATNFPQFVVQVEGFNPLLYLDEANWGAVSAAPLGPSQINRAPAQGYLVKADLVRAIANATSPTAASMSLAIKSELLAVGTGTGNGMNPTVDIRLWVDSSGRVVTIQGSPPGAGVGTTTITLSRFGVAVTVTKPALTTVIDIASLTPSGERENNGGGDSDGA